jgi:hypothetical protein
MMLARQFDAQPAPETLQLLQAIQQGAPLAAAAHARDAPYKGLYPFSRADRADFFGREATVDYLVQRLNEITTAFLIGPSGSGKSSIIRAGVIPTLLSIGSLARLTQRQDGRAHWSGRLLSFALASIPLHALAEAIAHLRKGGGDVERIERRI